MAAQYRQRIRAIKHEQFPGTRGGQGWPGARPAVRNSVQLKAAAQRRIIPLKRTTLKNRCVPNPGRSFGPPKTPPYPRHRRGSGPRPVRRTNDRKPPAPPAASFVCRGPSAHAARRGNGSARLGAHGAWKAPGMAHVGLREARRPAVIRRYAARMARGKPQEWPMSAFGRRVARPSYVDTPRARGWLAYLICNLCDSAYPPFTLCLAHYF